MYGQTGSIFGNISDITGSGVMNATVKVKSLTTAAERAISTDKHGEFSLPDLPAGHYDVIVEKAGFISLRFQDIELTITQSLSLSGVLRIGVFSQAIEVVGSVMPTIDLSDAQISNVVDQKRIQELPLITRDPYELILLSSGAQRASSVFGGFSVNGQRERSNNFLIDGVDSNDPSVPGAAHGTSVMNPDSTQEFRVITNNYLPEFGRNSGAIVELVTRSGTNTFHGAAYEFNRINALAARDYLNPRPESQNPVVRNQFGASLEGPLKLNKTFFFLNSEWDRFRTTLPNADVVPTSAFKSGVFIGDGIHINLVSPASPQNVLGLPLDPTVQKLLSLYPNPNGPALDGLRAYYYFPTASPLNAENVTLRLDHRVNDRYTVFARYIYTGVNIGNSFDEVRPGVGGESTNGQGQNVAFSFSTTFRPGLVNELRFGINRYDVLFACKGIKTIDGFSSQDAFGFGTDYTFATATGVPTISDFGCSGLGNSNSQFRRTGTWHYSDQLYFASGKHNIKAGGEFRYAFENGYDAFGSRPTVDFAAFGLFNARIVNCTGPCANDDVLQTMASALLGFPGRQSQNQYYLSQGQRTPTDFRRFVQREYGLFFQDSWRVFPNVTLELGIRYEYDGVPFERDGNLSNLISAQASDPAPITFQTVGPGTGRQIYHGDPYDLEPRVGFAWDFLRDGKTSVRVGYGIFHDRVFGNLFTNLKLNPPFVAGVQSYPNLDFLNGMGSAVTIGTLRPPATRPAPSATVRDQSLLSVTILDPNLRTPYTQAWNIGVQRQLAKSTSVEVDYVGSGTHRLFRSLDGNPPLPWLVNAAHANNSLPVNISGSILRIASVAGYPSFTGNIALEEPVVIKSIGNATYNGLQIMFDEPFSKNVQFQAAYTWSHSIDDAGDPIVAPSGNRSIARNSFNLKEERGSSDYDLRHRFTLNYVMELPFGPGHTHFSHGAFARAISGWQLSGISTFQSGHPFDIYSSRDSEYTGLTNRPDLVGNPAILPGSPRTQTGPPITAFAVQPFGRPGTLGRNTFTGPTLYDTNLNLTKTFHIAERVRLQFRVEFYNVFNRIQFDVPGPGGNSMASPGTFGQSSSAILQPDGTSSARQIQLALKLLF